MDPETRSLESYVATVTANSNRRKEVFASMLSPQLKRYIKDYLEAYDAVLKDDGKSPLREYQVLEDRYCALCDLVYLPLETKEQDRERDRYIQKRVDRLIRKNQVK